MVFICFNFSIIHILTTFCISVEADVYKLKNQLKNLAIMSPVMVECFAFLDVPLLIRGNSLEDSRSPISTSKSDPNVTNDHYAIPSNDPVPSKSGQPFVLKSILKNSTSVVQPKSGISPETMSKSVTGKNKEHKKSTSKSFCATQSKQIYYTLIRDCEKTIRYEQSCKIFARVCRNWACYQDFFFIAAKL